MFARANLPEGGPENSPGWSEAQSGDPINLDDQAPWGRSSPITTPYFAATAPNSHSRYPALPLSTGTTRNSGTR